MDLEPIFKVLIQLRLAVASIEKAEHTCQRLENSDLSYALNDYKCQLYKQIESAACDAIFDILGVRPTTRQFELLRQWGDVVR